MRELIAEFRKEVDLTMREHVDGLQRELVEATSRVEATFVKSSFELLQDEVGWLRAQFEGMAYILDKPANYPSERNYARRDPVGKETSRQGIERSLGALRMGPPHPAAAATTPLPDVRFMALQYYILYRLEDTREDADSYDRRTMLTKRKAMYHRI